MEEQVWVAPKPLSYDSPSDLGREGGIRVSQVKAENALGLGAERDREESIFEI